MTMPYHVAKTDKCPVSTPWGCIKTMDGTVMGCHPTKEKAEAQMAALYANEPGMKGGTMAFKFIIEEGDEKVIRGAIASHKTATVDTPWDGPKAMADAPNDATVLHYMAAWYAGENPDQKGSYKFPHHTPKVGSAANLPACRDGLARISNSSIPDGDKSGVQAHLQKHIKDGGGEVAKSLTRNEMTAARKEAWEKREAPAGFCRMQAFPSELRMRLVERDGKQFFEVEGVATVFDRKYTMYDMFGPYWEQVSNTSLDKSMSNKPDVAFLVNHKGVTMARTSNGSLELNKDRQGLNVHAFLNAERQDVKDFASALQDQLITEMSFAFQLLDGTWEWADDTGKEHDEFTITEADINRGDVSGVNYGANPYTSIAARGAEWLRELDYMPAAVRREALAQIQSQLEDADEVLETRSVSLDIESVEEREAERTAIPNKGRSTSFVANTLALMCDEL